MSDETYWLSVRLASRVTSKVLMLSEKGIWEPAIVGVETEGKLRRRCLMKLMPNSTVN